MHIRIVGFSDRYDDYKLLGYTEVENISEVFKTLDYMRKNEIPLIINTNDVIDTDGEEYYIDSITMVFPKVVRLEVVLLFMLKMFRRIKI